MTVSATAGAAYSQNPLLKGRHRPDFAQPFALGADDSRVLSMRGLNADQQRDVGAVFADARAAVQAGQGRSYLSKLDAATLSLLQRAASLADPVNVSALSEEGAENLLLAPTEAVDLNGDGMIQTGSALGFSFPPVDASPALRSAWEKTISGMSEGDALTLSLMVGGPMSAVDGSGYRSPDFSNGFDWNSHMKNLIAGNEMSKPYNTAEEYRKIDSQLNAFWSALREYGLA